VTGGIVGSGDLTISAGGGMSINIAVGEVVVPGSTAATQSGYVGRVSSTTNLAISASDPTNPRVDRVSALITDSAYSGGTNTFTVAVETGTPTSGATLSNLNGVAAAPASSYTLGYVLVPAGSASVTGGNISNVAAVVLPGIGPWFTGTEAAKPAAGVTYRGISYLATDSNALYYCDGSAWRTIYGSRGATNISTSQSTSSASFTTLATPDQVTNVVLPTNGLIQVWYQATWQNSVANSGQAVIFVGSNAVSVAPSVAAGAGFYPAGGPAQTAQNHPLVTIPTGLAGGTVSDNVAYGGDVTTGQTVGVTKATEPQTTNVVYGLGGPCSIFAAAGTYTISVQFRAFSGGSVTASNRKLWVQAIPFA
jgi:hypothetical protein